MQRFPSRFLPALFLFGIFLPCCTSFAAGFNRGGAMQTANASDDKWQSSGVIHLYGLPGVKAKASGQLSIDADGLRFNLNGAVTAVSDAQILAVNAGDERVELWGTKGRILRMMIPDGGGMMVATMAHHKIDMLTVEFRDDKGGYHAAVFELAAGGADHAMQAAAQLPYSHTRPQEQHCDGKTTQAHTVQLAIPDWRDWNIPFAYRALVYEHLMDQFSREKLLQVAYRDGALEATPECAQYTVSLKEDQFKAGSQVTRAAIGPLAYFVGSTQISLKMSVADETGHEVYAKQIKASVHDEAESNKVAEKIAKKLGKEFAKWQKQYEKQSRRAPKAA